MALGDTTGLATPATMKDLVGRLQREAPAVTLIAHLHDTRGTGLVNAVAAYEAGVRYFDCSFGGVGGHPAQVQYGGGYTGNVCSEDLVNLFESLGIRTGIDLAALLETSVSASRRSAANCTAASPAAGSIRCCGRRAEALGQILGVSDRRTKLHARRRGVSSLAGPLPVLSYCIALESCIIF